MNGHRSRSAKRKSKRKPRSNATKNSRTTKAAELSKFGFDLECDDCRQRVQQYLEHNGSSIFSQFHLEVQPRQLQRGMASGCQFCSLILKTLEHYLRYSEFDVLEPDQAFIVELDSGCLKFHQQWPYFPEIRFYCPPGVEPAWSSLEVLPEPSADYSSKECIDMVKTWFTTCVNEHDSKCQSERPAQLPSRLVYLGDDSTSLRLLQIEGKIEPYAAFSHCWGKGLPPKATSLTSSSKEQTLEWESLPATFKDAITVARWFGLRHLWIDSLCIIQDDEHDWEIESAKMGSIFEGASVVIAASMSADPNCSFLAPRQNQWTDTLELNYRRKDGKDCLVKARAVVLESPSLDPLDTRAWTYQEQRLAVRLLRFTTAELQWHCRATNECQCSSWHIARGIGLFRQGPMYCKSIRMKSQSSVFSQWRWMLGIYTQKKLTKKSDLLPALSGIAAAAQQTTSSDYLAGLWKDDLDSLCWQSMPVVNEIPGRCDAEEYLPFSQQRTLASYRAPTFSWASIDGDCDFVGNGRCVSCDDAVILEARCTPKGANPFGEVIDGHIVLEALTVEATMTVEYSDSDDLGHEKYIKVTYCGSSQVMNADLPLVECLAQTKSGTYERTMRRASATDTLRSVTGPVVCVALFCRENENYTSLALGLSSTTPGAFERLGLIHGRCGSADGPRAKDWFENAERSVIKIV